MSKSILPTEPSEIVNAKLERFLPTFPFKVWCFKTCEEINEKLLLDSNGNIVTDTKIIIKNQNPFNERVCNYYVIHRHLYHDILYLHILQQLEEQLTTSEVTNNLPKCEPVLTEIRECKTNRTNKKSIRMFELVWEFPDMDDPDMDELDNQDM